jgi:hypothetical protein
MKKYTGFKHIELIGLAKCLATQLNPQPAATSPTKVTAANDKSAMMKIAVIMVKNIPCFYV